jgi:uncharacterized protein YjgD (DUF1641 family)
MVTSLASTGSALGELAQTAADDDARDGLETVLTSVAAAERDQPEAVSAVGLLRAARDPEVRYGLGYLLSVSRAIGQQRAANGE